MRRQPPRFGVTPAGNFSGVPGLASLVKTGQAPTIKFARNFTPAAASLVKTGQVPTITFARNFTVPVSSLLKSGQTPTLAITGAFVGTPGLARLLKSGFGLNIQIPSAFKGGAWPGEDRRRKRKPHERAFVRLPDGQLTEIAAEQAPDAAIWAKNYIEARNRAQKQIADEEDEVMQAALMFLMLTEDD